ncbi:MAG: hypothetical protein U0414_39120 [Polyangiaceae bacterium]
MFERVIASLQGALCGAVCILSAACTSDGGDAVDGSAGSTGSAGENGTAFDAPYPDPRCGQVEQGHVEPTTEAELEKLVVGRWIACVGAGAPGLEIAGNHEWYWLRQVSVGRFDRDLSMEHGTWEPGGPTVITFHFEVPDPPGSSGTGGTFTRFGDASFSAEPRKMTLGSGANLVPVYVLHE